MFMCTIAHTALISNTQYNSGDTEIYGVKWQEDDTDECEELMEFLQKFETAIISSTSISIVETAVMEVGSYILQRRHI